MAKLRSVNTHFWTDGFVIDLDPAEKLLFLYLITNPLTTLAGCYELPLRQMVFDTGIDQSTIQEMLKRFEKRGKIVYREGWILLVNFLKNQNLNTNMHKNVLSDLEKAPDWIKAFIATNPKPFGTLSKAFKGFEIKEKGIEEESNPMAGGCETGEPNLKTSETEPRPPRSMTPATPAAEKLDMWLDAVAVKIGAVSSLTMANRRNWERMCMSAISEGMELSRVLSVIDSERERTRGQPQFFSADGVLKRLQMSIEPEKPKRRLARDLIAEERKREEALAGL